MRGSATPERALRQRLTRRARRVLAPVRRLLRLEPAPGKVDFGHLRRVTPIERGWGFRRGRVIDRAYLEAFLEEHRADIRGRVLEVGGNAYTRRYGTGVVSSDVLNVEAGDPGTTIVGDLADAPHIPDASFDCIVLTQVLQLVYDVPAALATVRRLLAPGGVALITVPGITRIADRENERWGDFWRFTATSAERLGADVFGPEHVSVRAYGNVLSATAFLYGLACEDLEPHELEAHDPLYEVIVGLRAVVAPG